MIGSNDDQSEERVREDTIENFPDSNDLGDLQRVRRGMRDELDITDDDREADLLEHRLEILEDAIDRVED